MSFLTQQRAAGRFAGLCDAPDHRGGHVHIQATTGEVVEEEEWLSTLCQHIVYTHAHQVLTQNAVLPARLGDLMI